MAYGITYMVKGFETAYSIDCTTIEQDLTGYFNNGLTWVKTNLGL
jgi:hypothetical protein